MHAYRGLGLDLHTLNVVEGYPHSVVHSTSMTSEPLRLLLSIGQDNQPEERSTHHTR